MLNPGSPGSKPLSGPDPTSEERIISIIIIRVVVNCPMARLCRSFQAYLGFPSKESVDRNENENENDTKKSEKLGDPWSLSFESLLESTPVSKARPYSTEQQNSNHNSCTNDGLRSCTESLGFESSDEREDCSSHAESNFKELAAFDNDRNENDCSRESDGVALRDGGIRRAHGHVGAKKGAGVACFPPPLSSMGPNGQPSLFLKPLRKDGRFLLQEVKLPRHECLHAWRQDGRLRLQLVLPSDQPSVCPDADVRQADECDKVGDICASSTCDGETRVASLEEERAHVDCFRRGAAADVSLALYQEALGRRCHNNTKCMTSTWKPRCITT